MSEYIVKRFITYVFKVEAVDEEDALDHAQKNIDDIEDATTTNVFEEWEVEGRDPFDVPLTEEEQARADYENAMLIQSKRDRKEWESSL